jgi:hypothetical protein
VDKNRIHGQVETADARRDEKRVVPLEFTK